MTTYHTTEAAFTNADDTAFRAWITAMHNALVGMGLVQTDDTGQADFSTVAKPVAANTSAGLRMYRFNDTLQATAPIFVRLEVGTGANITTTYGWRITVGVATNGAGSFVGTTVVGSGWVSQATSTFTGVNDTYACHTEGAAWMAFYIEQVTTTGAMAGFAVLRSCDDTGAPTTEGASVYFRSGATVTTAVYSMRFEAIAGVLHSFTSSAALPALAPFNMADSHVGTDIQIFPHFSATPRVRQSPYAFAYVTSELTHASPIVAEPFAGVSHTYIPMQGNTMGLAVSGGTGGQFGTALIWE